MYRTIFLCLFLLLTALVHARITYVAFDATGARDGSSWANAHPDLQDAIDAVVGDGLDTIFVQAGTYLPPRTNLGNGAPHLLRARTFTASTSVRIFGGFAGGETALSQRNWRANATILSGDLGTVGDDTDNAYHVLKLEEGGVVEVNGFYVRHGRANGPGTSANGSGVYVREMDSAILRNLLIEDHEALAYGGGVYLAGFGPDSAVLLEDLEIRHCRAAEGAGLFGYRGSGRLVANRLWLYDNHATLQAGGVLLSSFGEVDLANLLITHNTAGGNGGAFWLRGMRGRMTNLTVYGNTSGGLGGGYYGDLNVFIDLYNAIFWHNADSTGGSSPTSQLAEDGTVLNVHHCNIQHSGGSSGWSADATDAGGNLALDPRLVDPLGGDGLPGTADDDFRLAVVSPCIDAGTATAPNLPATDFFGDPRFQGVGVDMGISENPDGSPFPVEWLSFTGERSPASAALQWETAREVNHAYFEVQRRLPGQGHAWQAVGQVRSETAQPQGQRYAYRDALPASAQRASYLSYRLRQVDLDGRESFSRVLTLARPLTPLLGWSVFPNPARDRLHLTCAQVPDHAVQVSLIDATGRACWQQGLTLEANGTQVLPVASLPRGLYWLRVVSPEQAWQQAIQLR